MREPEAPSVTELEPERLERALRLEVAALLRLLGNDAGVGRRRRALMPVRFRFVPDAEAGREILITAADVEPRQEGAADHGR